MSFVRVSLLVLSLLAPAVAGAQPLGTYQWHLQPFCNVVTLTVTRAGSGYTLDGFDDQCGGTAHAPTTGSAVLNPDGTVEIGLHIVTAPSAAPVHVAARLNLATLGGTWQDSAGNRGSLVLHTASQAGGPARPPSAVIPPAIALRDDGGFLAGGAETMGAIPATGSGTRMMWHPAKAAFRAGSVSGAAWDDPSVGLYSIALGRDNIAFGRSSIALGENTTAIGNQSLAVGLGSAANGQQSLAVGHSAIALGARSVALGSSVTADGYATVALGTLASGQAGAFVFGDAAGEDRVVASANEFRVRATGGTRFFSNVSLSAGVVLAPGASAWASVSDVNMKTDFRDLDGEEVLAKVARMPIQEWRYKAQDASIRHVGPTAQDFHAAFGLGEDPLRIGTIDADGVALRAIQALEARTRELAASLSRENAALRDELATLREQLAPIQSGRQQR